MENELNHTTIEASELLRMAEVDQTMRAKYTETKQWDSSVDEQNTKRLIEIVKNNGWPRISMFGKEVAKAAWLIIQHADADPDFQRYCLDQIHLLPDGEISLDHLALLEDRVRVNSGKQQLYGTQFSLKKDQFGPLPIEDIANLDSRRQSMGLTPFTDYTEEMRVIYIQHQAST